MASILKEVSLTCSIPPRNARPEATTIAMTCNRTMTHGASDKRALSRCISAASFWAPIWVRPESEWLEHAPFGFWLIDALRPRTIVELGTRSGYSLAVFCQAVQAAGLDCRCYGVDKWQDDTQEGTNGEEIFRAISDHNEVYYKSFSSLIRSDFDQARAHFAGRIKTISSTSMDATPTKPFWPNTRHGNRGCPNRPSFFFTVRTPSSATSGSRGCGRN